MNPDNIEEFVSMMGLFQTTSTHFMLTFWDHGGAWAGFGDDEHTAGSNGTVNNLDGLFAAVAAGLQDTYLGRLDILGFDACIMADYSVLHYLAKYGVTKYYVASEVSEPGDGWDYTAIDPTQSDPVGFAKALIDGFVNQGDVLMEGAGAGYTLALFDMDRVSAFLAQFDSFVRTATAAIEAHDYGLLMAILRGQAATIPAEEDFMIYDLGLFLEALTADSNLFWSTCDDRVRTAGQNAAQYLNDSILYFQADFVRRDMTGSTIFYSTSDVNIHSFYAYNDDMTSSNYLLLLTAMNETLDAVQRGDAEFTTDSCSAAAPSNFTFAVHGNKVVFSEDYSLYKMETEVTATVMEATASVQLERTIESDINETLSLIVTVAELNVQIVDEDFASTQLVTYWDGRVASFVNALSNESSLFDELDLGSERLYSSGLIEYVSYDDADAVPVGYVVKYPLYVYDDADDVPDDISDSNSSANVGYLQFEVHFNPTTDGEGDGDGESASTMVPLGEVKLYEIDMDQGVISEVAATSQRIIAPLEKWWTNDTADPFMTTEMASNWSWDGEGGDDDGSYYQAMGLLVWPNFTIELAPMEQDDADIVLTASDVFGNEAVTAFGINNASAWNVSTATSTTTETPMASTEEPESSTVGPTETTPAGPTATNEPQPSTTEEDGGRDTARLQHGLDDVPGFVWLILLGALLLLMSVFAVMWYRARKQYNDMIHKGSVGKSPYVPLDDRDDPQL